MKSSEEIIKEIEGMPEVQCNYCNAIFKGSHDCDYNMLKNKLQKYERALKQIQNNYPVEDVDYIPITGLYEIQLIIKNALGSIE